jgi:hypothetical protein
MTGPARVALLGLLVVLAGCSSTGRVLANRVTVAADCKAAHVVSEWGPVGIASRIDPADAAVIAAAVCGGAR